MLGTLSLKICTISDLWFFTTQVLLSPTSRRAARPMSLKLEARIMDLVNRERDELRKNDIYIIFSIFFDIKEGTLSYIQI